MLAIKDLVKKAQEGEVESFAQLVDLYQDRLYSQCCHLAGNADDAQDLAQDVFIQAFKGIKSFRQEADLGTWLYRIAVNQWANYCRRKSKVIAFSLDEPMDTSDGEVNRELAATQESPLERLERTEVNALLNKALERLVPEFKIALVLRDIEGYSYEEIAKLLRCSLGTVKSRINRGRKALKKELEEANPDGWDF